METRSIRLYIKTIILTIQIYFEKLFKNYDLKLYSINDLKMIVHFKKDAGLSCLQDIQDNIGRKVDQNDFKEKIQNNAIDDREIVLQNMFIYISEFLVKEHPLLGRKGPVCPFVPGSIKIESIYFSVVEKQDIDSLYVQKIMLAQMRRFQSLKPINNRLKVYKALVIVFPKISLLDAQELIDAVQKQLKVEFVKRGLMIGEFHLLNNSIGLRNPDFYPLRTPYPVLAIRHMVASDIAFMTPQDCDDKTKIKFLKGYIKTFERSEYWGKQIEQAKTLLQEIMIKKQ